MQYQGIFKNRYSIPKCKDWIKKLGPEAVKFFVDLGHRSMREKELSENITHGQAGGIARAKKAKRDRRGRFTK